MATSEPRDTSGERPVVCVFCASSPGVNPAHIKSAHILGAALHEAGYKVIYGGGTMGIMGELAKTVVSMGSPEDVEGIIPKALMRTEKDPSTRNGESVHHAGGKRPEAILTQEQVESANSDNVVPQSEFGRTTIVNDMHTRKGLMAQRVRQGGPGSGFVALAGGYGTIEEVMEMVTWNQLGIHKLPVVVVNIDHYWDGLLTWVRKAVDDGFVGKANANIMVEVQDPTHVVDALQNYQVAEGRFILDWETSSTKSRD